MVGGGGEGGRWWCGPCGNEENNSLLSPSLSSTLTSFLHYMKYLLSPTCLVPIVAYSRYEIHTEHKGLAPALGKLTV